MKRLLCIVSAMNAGGAETFLMKIYRMIDKTQYQMDFCVNEQSKGFYDDEIIAMGGMIFRIPSKSENYKEYKRQLLNLIESHKYSNVLRITSNSFGFLDCKIAKKAGAKKCIVRSSNSADAEGLYALIAHRLGKVLFSKYVDVKIAPSDLAAKYTFGEKAYSSGDVNILHNGLDIDRFAYNESDRRAIRQEFRVSVNEHLLGHIGRFTKQKNHSFLIELFEQYHKVQPESKLILIGDGEKKEEIMRQIMNRNLEEFVILTGIRNDIEKILSAMDVFLLPSFYEGMPNVIIEAQANGLPCIISESITKEANVTGLVSYMPIAESSKATWIDQIKMDVGKNRISTKEQLVNGGYDISAVVRRFTELCYFN